PGDATDVGAAFEAAARELRDRRDASDREARIVYIGDGVASVGEIDAGRPAQDVASTLAGLDARVTTVGVGTETDELVLAELARRGGGSHLAFAPGRSVRAEALAVLSAQYGAALEDPVLSLPEGLGDVEPRELPAVRAGDELLVLARAKGRVRGEATLRGKAAGRPYEQRYAIDIEPTDAPGNGFVPRLWAETRIAALTLKDAATNKDEIVRLSREHRTLSRFTSLLVLESEAMYRAFEVERPERVDDWTGEEPIREQMFGGLIANDDNDAAGRHSGAGRGRGAPPPSVPPESGSRSMRPARTAVQRWVDLSGPSEPSPSQRRRVEQLEKALDEAPDSRDRHRALFLALSRVGDADKALQVVEKWWARDRMDPEVLERMAEAEMARGRGERAARLLGSTVELAPRDAALHERLAAAFEAAGMDARACAHRRAIA
ncbi:MAG: hypothetical protein QME96_18065, partial [Myxococcota bacterium]|nr:hypothetical protein [Myxococcota bacterium]